MSRITFTLNGTAGKLLKQYKGKKDFTCFVTIEDLEPGLAIPEWTEVDSLQTSKMSRLQELKNGAQQQPEIDRSQWPSSWSGDVTLRSKGCRIRGRALFAKCAAGHGYSISVRSAGKERKSKPLKCFIPESCSWNRKKQPPEALISCWDLWNKVGELLFPADTHTTGLVVVSGSTNSAKSIITRGLVAYYLNHLKSKVRRSHLLTFEDPVETYLAEPYRKDASKPEAYEWWRKANNWRLDYTPRELGKDKDCANIAKGLKDALRQTPSAVFIGETRNARDWNAILEFAGTGHLVVTTTHASSLVETIHNIMVARKASTPAEYGDVARRIVGVIHIEPAFWRKKNGTMKDEKVALLPALWRRTPVSEARLVSDGLSSILPERSDDDQGGSFGRLWFAERLKGDNSEEIWVQIREQAAKYDIEGR